MSCFIFQALPFSLTLLFVSTFSFSFSHEISQPLRLQERSDSGLIDEGVYGSGFVSWGMRRSVIEGNDTINSSFLIFAKHRTFRIDPLNGFKHYTGGWNLNNTHYWASLGFSAAPLFIIAAKWLVGFGICLFCICLYHFCCQRPHYGYSKIAYALSLIFLILFTIAAIIGSIILYTGQGRFHGSTVDTVDYLLMQANLTVNSLRNVSDYLSFSKHTGVNNVFLYPDQQAKIDQVDAMINASTGSLARQTVENTNDMLQVLNIVRLTLILVAAVMLVLAFLGFLLSILGMQIIVNILVIIGWILVAGTFILGGVFLLFHNFVGDICVPMDEWVQNPTAHTVLDNILPCVDNATARESLSRSKQVAFQLVNVVNQYIGNVANRDFPPYLTSVYYNQSGPLISFLCNPFDSNLMDRKCVVGEVDLDNARQVWKKYVCVVSANRICSTQGRITPSFYNQMAASVNVTYGLYRYSPFLVELQDCTFVRDTFTQINRENCPGLLSYSKWVHVGLAMVSAAVMLSLIFWVIYARERRHRVYTKQYDAAHNGQEELKAL